MSFNFFCTEKNILSKNNCGKNVLLTVAAKREGGNERLMEGRRVGGGEGGREREREE